MGVYPKPLFINIRQCREGIFPGDRYFKNCHQWGAWLVWRVLANLNKPETTVHVHTLQRFTLISFCLILGPPIDLSRTGFLIRILCVSLICRLSHVPPITSCLIWSPKQYLARSTNHYVHHYTSFSNCLFIALRSKFSQHPFLKHSQSGFLILSDSRFHAVIHSIKYVISILFQYNHRLYFECAASIFGCFHCYSQRTYESMINEMTLKVF